MLPHMCINYTCVWVFSAPYRNEHIRLNVHFDEHAQSDKSPSRLTLKHINVLCRD